jgi:hypothetical protein
MAKRSCATPGRRDNDDESVNGGREDEAMRSEDNQVRDAPLRDHFAGAGRCAWKGVGQRLADDTCLVVGCIVVVMAVVLLLFLPIFLLWSLT